jgi:poly(3-hydroxybutyrate) depolymerase
VEISRRQVLRGLGVSALAATVARAGLLPAASADAEVAPNSPLGPAQSLDNRPYPAYDYSRANKLPSEMTGYWVKSFDVAGSVRTAKVYISPETPIRSYFTVIAVPDGVDTGQFLEETGWRDIADQREEALFVLEPGPQGWGDTTAEAPYVQAAMNFYQANLYFSIFGEHYLVGYGAGAPALEAWAVAHPLRVIAQVYLDSPGLSEQYLDQIGAQEFDGTTDVGYSTVVFPPGFDLLRYDETVLPTWYVNPNEHSIASSLAYWKSANDTTRHGVRNGTLGTVYQQVAGSGRWMTSYAGSISQVAVLDRPMDYRSASTTRQLVAFLTYYTRYENFFAYSNQLFERADYARLGVEVKTMMVEGFIREYSVYVPRSARPIWGMRAPVVFVWPGNSQTDKVYFDAAQWWKVAESEGCILVTICEQYSNTSVSVSHRASNTFFLQLREVMIRDYGADPSRFYSTGQSAGSILSQTFAVAKPDYFAALATTSGPASPDASGNVAIDGVTYPATGQMIPDYMIYGYGDLPVLAGDLWDATQNSLDSWAAYHLQVSGLELADVDTRDGVRSGWHDRFRTWTWRQPDTHVPVLKLTKNVFRSHNTMSEESPMQWDFLKHYSRETDGSGRAVRYYSPSAFRVPGDKIVIGS